MDVMSVIVVFLILGAIIAFVAYWIGLREAHENQAKRIIEENGAASGWEPEHLINIAK